MAVNNLIIMEKINEILLEYDLSRFGFLTEIPILRLGNKFLEWESLVGDLPFLNANRLLKSQISTLPEFPINELKLPWHFKRAYVVLSIIINSYVFGDSNVEQMIPKKLAIPMQVVSTYLGINPILTHASVDLYNWYLVDPNGLFELDNLKSTSLMTGTRDEERFYLTMVAIEGIGGNVIQNILSMKLIHDDNDLENKISEFNNHLENIRKNIFAMIRTLKRIREKCDPVIFYNVLRPFLAGWENNDKLANGMIYEGVSSEPQFYCGGSAAQSSLFQVIDAAFNIQHNDHYFVSIRNYMPLKHRQFIEYVEKNIHIDIMIQKINNLATTNLFNECLESIKLFRMVHMNIVKDYIIRQIKVENNDEIKGTGGTLLANFLGQSIKDTGDTITKKN